MGQMCGRIFSQDPTSRLAAQHLITQVDGDDRGPGRLGRCVLQQKTPGRSAIMAGRTRQSGFDVRTSVLVFGHCEASSRTISMQIRPRQLQVDQDDVHGVGDAECDEVRVAVGDTDDIEIVILPEQTGQPEGEQLFGRDDDNGDLRIGQRQAARGAAPSGGWWRSLLSTD